MKRRSSLRVDYPTPPTELMRCYVEDWVEPEEIAATATAVSALPPGQPTELWWGPMLTAFRRHSNARFAWFAEHEVPRAMWCSLIPATGAPRWRTSPSGGARA